LSKFLALLPGDRGGGTGGNALRGDLQEGLRGRMAQRHADPHVEAAADIGQSQILAAGRRDRTADGFRLLVTETQVGASHQRSSNGLMISIPSIPLCVWRSSE